MTTYQTGEIVDITIKGARIAETTNITDSEIVIGYSSDQGEYAWPLPLGAPDIKIEHVAPAEWPPQPGDVWGDADAGGITWFAQCHYADYDNPEDFEGCNDQGWRIVMVPLKGGTYGGSKMQPEALRKTADLFLMYRAGVGGGESQ